MKFHCEGTCAPVKRHCLNCVGVAREMGCCCIPLHVHTYPSSIGLTYQRAEMESLSLWEDTDSFWRVGCDQCTLRNISDLFFPVGYIVWWYSSHVSPQGPLSAMLPTLHSTPHWPLTSPRMALMFCSTWVHTSLRMLAPLHVSDPFAHNWGETLLT